MNRMKLGTTYLLYMQYLIYIYIYIYICRLILWRLFNVFGLFLLLFFLAALYPEVYINYKILCLVHDFYLI